MFRKTREPPSWVTGSDARGYIRYMSTHYDPPDVPDERPPDDSSESDDRPEQHGEEDRPADYAETGWDDRQEDGTPEAPRPSPPEDPSI